MWKALAVVGAVFAGLVVFAVTRGDRSSPQAAMPKTPLGCLEQASLSNVRKTGATSWVGDQAVVGFGVSVDQMGTRSDAAAAVAAADLVHAVQAGTYAVIGPVVGTDDLGKTAAVAACLGE